MRWSLVNRYVNVLVVAGVFLSSALCLIVRAEGPASGKAKSEKEKPALTDMTLTGKVTKEEKQRPNGKTMVHYVLTDSAGNKVMLKEVMLSEGGKHGKQHAAEQAAPVNLDEYVNKDVTIIGKGFQKEKEGKKMTRLVEITKIETAAKTTTPAAQ